MKKITFLWFMLLLLSINLSMKAQNSSERLQFYNDYKTAVNNKTAIINADPVLYQGALNSGWFQQTATGLKNAEDCVNRVAGNKGGPEDSPTSSNGTCSTATPFCTQSGATYPAGVNTGTGESGPDYSCLGSEPNPAWFFLKIGTAGDLHITETNSSNYDVDFILWGPFTSQYACGSLTSDKVADCSYSGAAVEYIDIASASVGQYYILLITNFSNSSTNISLTKTSGSATTDCNIIYVPQAPNATAATSVTGTSFQANWTASSGDPYPATSFALDVSTQSNFASFVSGYNSLNVGNVLTYPVTGLSPGTTYYYRLRGENTSGQGPNSNIITVNTPSTPNPTSVSVSANPICNGSSTQLTANGSYGTVYWYTGSCGGTYITTGNPINVSPTSTTTYYARNYYNSQFSSGCASATITVNPLPTVNIGPAMAAICQGETSAALGGSFGGGATLAIWSAPSGTFANNTGSTPGSATFTAAANSTSPITLTLTTSGGSCGITSASKDIVVNVPAAMPPSASATPTGTTTASLSWEASGGTAPITYYWAVGTSSEVTYESGYTKNGFTTDLTASVTDLLQGTVYYLSVKAVNICTTSAYRTSSGFLTYPGAPTADAATLIRANSFRANWSAPAGGVSGYYLDLSEDISFSSFVTGYENKDVGNVVSLNISGLKRATNYYYRVRAYNSTGSSENSNPISLTTLPLHHFVVEAATDGNIGTQTAGNSFNIKITAQDAENTTVTDFIGTVDLTTNSVFNTGGGTTPGFVAGVLSPYTVMLTQAGTLKTITATRTSGAETGTSNTFTVTPAAIDYFTVAGITDPQIAGTLTSPTVTAYDQYNNVKTDHTGTIAFSSSDVKTSTLLPSNYLFLSGDNGVKTFTNGVKLTTTGEQWVKVTGDTKTGQQSDITITPAAIDYFTVASITDPQIAGTLTSPTVTAYDQYNNVKTDYTGTIAFSSSDVKGSTLLPPNYLFLSGDNGVKTFTNGVKLTTTGEQWVKVTGDTKTGQQSGITITPAAIDYFTVASITDPQIAGTLTSPTVTAYDQYNNVKTDYTGTIAFSSSDVKGSTLLPSNYLFLSGDNGVKTFTNGVKLTTTGEQWVKVTGDTKTGQQSGITITPDVPHHLTLVGPDEVVTGTASSNFTIQVYDQYENATTVTGATSFSLSTNSTGTTIIFNPASPVMNNGSGSTTFTYKDSKLGYYTITATRASGNDVGLIGKSATHSIEVNLTPWEACNTSASADGVTEYFPDGSVAPVYGEFELSATGLSTVQNDVHNFVYQPIGNRGTVIARVSEIENGGWLGVEMRENCNPGAKTVLFKTRYYNPNVIIGYRSATGKSMMNASQVAQLTRWMKIQRNGSQFIVYTSVNGTSWQKRYTATVSMSTNILAGIFTESVSSDRTSIASFDHAEVSTSIKSSEILDDETIASGQQVDVYPNPADELVNILMPDNESKVKVTLTSMQGNVILTTIFYGSEAQLNTSHLNPGVYVLRFETEGNVITKRLVIM